MTIYKFCFECQHEWQSEDEFHRDVERLCQQMNTSEWRKSDEPDWTVPDNLDDVTFCPLCAHDF